MAAPVVVGLNSTCSVTDCVGFNVTGRLPAISEKLAPVIVAASTVTGAVPVEVNVIVCVVAVFAVTWPKLTLGALTSICETRLLPLPVPQLFPVLLPLPLNGIIVEPVAAVL